MHLQGSSAMLTREAVPGRRRRALALSIILLPAVCGAWVCGSLTAAHGGGWDPGGDGALSLCGSGSAGSARCAEVIDSRWGSFDVTMAGRRFLVPTAFLGLAYFAGATAWFTLAGIPDARAKLTWGALLAVSGVSAAGSLFLLVTMAAVLKAWCGACLAAHALNLWLFAALLGCRLTVASVRPAAAAADRAAAQRATNPWLALGVSLAGVGGLWMYYDAASTAKHFFRENAAARAAIAAVEQDAGLLMHSYEASPALEVPVRAEGSPGDVGSRRHLVVYGDPWCRACVCFQVLLSRVIEPALGPDVLIEFRQFIPEVEGRSADAAPRVQQARAVEAARRLGGDTAMIQMAGGIRRSVANHRTPDFAAIAERIGLDAERLVGLMRDEQVACGIEEDTALARRLGVRQVPAAFLDGRAVPDLCMKSKAFWQAAGRRAHSDCEAVALDTGRG